jgi:hypothetical protein
VTASATTQSRHGLRFPKIEKFMPGGGQSGVSFGLCRDEIIRHCDKSRCVSGDQNTVS